MQLNEAKIGIIGLGYVGLPLAIAFAEKYQTIGFDINKGRVEKLELGVDDTLEQTKEEILSVKNNIQFISEPNLLSDCNVYIITVPTPIDENRYPDLEPLRLASKLVGQYVDEGNIVIYESTVYPGATEEECIPLIEAQSGLVFNKDFFAGYSPERINPGDKERPLKKIMKVTSGSNPEIAGIVDNLYASIIDAGTFLASSLKVAEACKVIENTQRDLNIALVNELSKIFGHLKIDTGEVLEAAGTKWNFLPFKPGLVGGHCIGVDPYYLIHKSQSVGYFPELLVAGRRLNDSMHSFVVDRLIKSMLTKRIHINGAKILILGITFKENCPDIRNTRVVELVKELSAYGAEVTIYDPWVNEEDLRKAYGLSLCKDFKSQKYDAAILTVAHEEFLNINSDNLKSVMNENSVFYDLKGVLPKNMTDIRL